MQSDNASANLTRREFVAATAAAGLLSMAGSLGFAKDTLAAEAFAMPPLPYPENALEPVISANTISFHYDKHTKLYYDNTNKMLEAKPMAGMTLEKVFLEAAKDAAAMALFNNAAQAWNHTFYWNGLKAGGGAPTGKLAEMIQASFGGMENCAKALTEAGMTQFGSGWAWLVHEGGKLSAVKTGNAGNPLTNGQKPLLAIDVWEHAYYLDYQNRRADYIKGVLEKLVNWEFVAKNLES
jgi:Fe-Mn family superoxide dismutase